MKTIFGLGLFVLLGISSPAWAQRNEDKGVEKAWKGTKKGVKKAANKTAQVSSKGLSEVKDKKSSTWMGPEGQTIYLTDDSRYYWVNGKGKRIYVSQSALRARNK